MYNVSIVRIKYNLDSTRLIIVTADMKSKSKSVLLLSIQIRDTSSST